jgi:hypothetical protein
VEIGEESEFELLVTFGEDYIGVLEAVAQTLVMILNVAEAVEYMMVVVHAAAAEKVAVQPAEAVGSSAVELPLGKEPMVVVVPRTTIPSSVDTAHGTPVLVSG